MHLEKSSPPGLKTKPKQQNKPLGLSFDMSDLYSKYLVSRNRVRNLKSGGNGKNVTHVDVNLLSPSVSGKEYQSTANLQMSSIHHTGERKIEVQQTDSLVSSDGSKSRVTTNPLQVLSHTQS